MLITVFLCNFLKYLLFINFIGKFNPYGLNIIDTSHFTGSQKLWFLQHFLVPCIQWPILIYEVPISLAFKLEQKASVYIQKWLKLHKSITSLSLYYSASPCLLPVRSLKSVFKSSKIRWHLLLKHSQDPSVSSCVPKFQAGHWEVKNCLGLWNRSWLGLWGVMTSHITLVNQLSTVERLSFRCL